MKSNFVGYYINLGVKFSPIIYIYIYVNFERKPPPKMNNKN